LLGIAPTPLEVITLLENDSLTSHAWLDQVHSWDDQSPSGGNGNWTVIEAENLLLKVVYGDR